MTEQRKVPTTFDEAAKAMLTPGAPRLTDAEAAQVDAETEPEGFDGRPSPLEQKAADPGDEKTLPAWVKVAPNLAIPPWKQIGYMLFDTDLTERPDLGDRTCVLWGLSVADERLARQATHGDSTRTYEEMAKRTIRCLDGVRANWDGKRGPGDVNRFWEEIGPKARMFIVNWYVQTHQPTVEETARFFLLCCTSRTSVVG